MRRPQSQKDAELVLRRGTAAICKDTINFRLRVTKEIIA